MENLPEINMHYVRRYLTDIKLLTKLVESAFRQSAAGSNNGTPVNEKKFPGASRECGHLMFKMQNFIKKGPFSVIFFRLDWGFGKSYFDQGGTTYIVSELNHVPAGMSKC